MPIDTRQRHAHHPHHLCPSWGVLAGLALAIVCTTPAMAGSPGLIPPGGNLHCDGITSQCVIYDAKGQRTGTVDQDGGADRWVVRDTRGRRTGTIDEPEGSRIGGREDDRDFEEGGGDEGR
jgi:hypothetical protein